MRIPSAVVALAIMMMWSGTSLAQAPCPAGRSLNGECAHGAMLASARTMAVLLSQPKISYTAYPILPSADRQYRYPHQLIPDQLKTTPVGVPPPPPPAPPPPPSSEGT